MSTAGGSRSFAAVPSDLVGSGRRLGRTGTAVALAFLLSGQAAADPRIEVSSDLPAAAAATEPCPADPGGEAPDAEAAAPEAPPGLGKLALEDGKYILGAPLRWSGKDWLVFSGVAAGVVALGFAVDVPARNKTRSNQTSALDDLTRVVEPFGAEYSWAVIGAYGIAGFVFRDPDARDIAVDSALASILASGVITPVLKRVIGRARPNQDEGSTAFHPFSGDQAFPSGHTTQAFAVASVISAHSDKVWVSIGAYTLAGLVGFSRIYHDAHWSSDVAAGAVIGTVVGRGLVAFNRRLRASHENLHVAFWPILDGDRRGLGVVARF